MSSKNFHKDMGNYLTQKRGSGGREKPKSIFKPLLKSFSLWCKQLRRSYRVFKKRISGFLSGDRHIDLNSLQGEVYVIERPKKTTFAQKIKNKFSKPKEQEQPDDVDVDKVAQIMKDNKL